jgi:hypothetical protein
MWILTLLKSAGKHNKVCPACLCVWNGYVLSDNGSNDARFVSAVFIPPNRHRPRYKFRAISYNRERFDKRCNLYDFDFAIGDVSAEGELYCGLWLFKFQEAPLFGANF